MTIDLTATQARRSRWHSQLLGGSDLTPTQVVERAIALQGQDLPAVLRAIAIRSAPGTTIAEVRAAFDRGELVRSWPMRGTLFATTPHRLAGLLAHTGDRTHQSTTLRRTRLGLDGGTLQRARAVILERLAVGPTTRADALAAWQAAGIDTDAGRGYHLLMHLSVAGLIHWGPFDESGSEQYLVRSPQVDVEQSALQLPEIVRGVILARGPMTEADLAWWTKLPKGVIRPALAAIPDRVDVSVDGHQTALHIGEPTDHDSTGVTLVPGFDEWILGYADRSLVASSAAFDALVPGGNGVFRPAVLIDGVVVGSWRVPLKAGRPQDPIIDLVEPITAKQRAAVDAALAAWPHG